MNVTKVNNYSGVPKFSGLRAARILSKASTINSWQQRLALGVAAMAIQPAIDLRNKQVDEETRKVSANRSFAKALVGMATGIAVRGGCMKAVEIGLQKDRATNYLAKITAENNTKEAIDKAKNFIKNKGGAKQYASIIGTIVALGVMLFTNFLVDAPLTNKLTDKLNKKLNNKNEEQKPKEAQTNIPPEPKEAVSLPKEKEAPNIQTSLAEPVLQAPCAQFPNLNLKAQNQPLQGEFGIQNGQNPVIINNRNGGVL